MLTLENMTTPELQNHHRYLLAAIKDLDHASRAWDAETKARGARTKANLQAEVLRTQAELSMAGAR
jgi:hypothetical protein